MVITLIKHGQTEEDFLRIIQGKSNKLMNDTGRRQCQKLRFQIKDKKYDYCYMSPLVRDVETAMILIGDKVEMIPDKRIIERDMGDLEGRNLEEFNAYKFWDYDLNRKDYNIEPVRDIFLRCQNFLDYVLKKYQDKNIIIVTDEAPYRVLRHLLLKKELKGKLFDGVIDNCKMEEFSI